MMRQNKPKGTNEVGDKKEVQAREHPAGNYDIMFLMTSEISRGKKLYRYTVTVLLFTVLLGSAGFIFDYEF